MEPYIITCDIPDILIIICYYSYMENIKELMKNIEFSAEELRGFFEKIIQLKEGLILDLNTEEFIISHQIEQIRPDLLKIEKVYGEPDFIKGEYGDIITEGVPVIGYTIQIRNQEEVRRLYADLYDLLYPDHISKFLFHNQNGFIWNCQSERCRSHNNKIGDLNSIEKISYYLSKIAQDGFYKCPKHGCKNGFSILRDGKINLWTKN